MRTDSNEAATVAATACEAIERIEIVAERRRAHDDVQLEDLETAAAVESVSDDGTAVRPFTRAKLLRAPLPDHLPRERVVVPAPTACPCCGGKLAKLGETITETQESPITSGRATKSTPFSESVTRDTGCAMPSRP
jgi:hypothetical protein